MLIPAIRDIINASRENGWIMEPEAKRLLSLAGIDVPDFRWAKEMKEAEKFASEIGYPLVAKVVSNTLIHKSDSGGVITGIDDFKEVKAAFDRFSKFEGFNGILIEEMLSGIELIIGAKSDYQFGPVILFGIGGTGVEIYRDTALKMAPLNQDDVKSMIKCLKARRLLEGYRGSDPVDLKVLSRLLLKFSELAMELGEDMESIDLNPVMCSSEKCVVVDARIMLSVE